MRYLPCVLLSMVMMCPVWRVHAACLQTAASPLTLQAEGVRYKGVALRALSDGQRSVIGAPITLNGVTYSAGPMLPGLVAEDAKTGRAVSYQMFALARAARWFTPKDDAYLPQGIRGLYRQGERLWMGSDGVGVVVYDTRNHTWSRYDTASAPAIGNHMDVLYADDQYVIVSFGYAEGRPQTPSLHIFSVAHGSWRMLTAIPSTDARCLGSSDGLVVARGYDYRPYAQQEYIPIGGDQTPGLLHPVITPYPGDALLLSYVHSETSRTELVVYRKNLDAAFTPAAPAK